MRCPCRSLNGVTLIFFFIFVIAILNLTLTVQRRSVTRQLEEFVVKIPPTFFPARESVILNDGVYTYHLNLSQFQSEFPYLQTYHCSVILTPWSEMKEEVTHPLLILAIKSLPGSGHRRNTLRRTWARQGMVDRYMVKPVFLVGRTEVPGQMEILKVENKEYGDILQWDFNEGHHNLSLKERCFLEWLHYNVPHVAFIFKGDDDEFVNPFNIVQYIKQHGLSPKMLHGALHRHSAVMRYSKYQISTKLFSHAKYPYFLSGGGFLFPGTSVRLLFEASKKLPVFPLDDVYFGFLALAANLTYRHDSRFYTFRLKYDACSYQRALVVHRIHSELLLKIWDELKSASCK